MKNRRKLLLLALVGFVAVVTAAVAAGPIMSRVEQPKYELTSTHGEIETRSYGPMIVARTVVNGDRKSAINEGFRLIAAYIFGENEHNVKVEMTAPVRQASQQNIAMTAPVTQQIHGESWTIQFIMPSEWSMDTLPLPMDERVTLTPVSPKQMLVIRFSGSASDALMRSKTTELMNYAKKRHLEVQGEPIFAFYNPPWTLPFLRRNEVMIQLADTSSRQQ